MSANYTTNITVDTNGGLILEFDYEEVDSVLIVPSTAVKIGFSDLSQALLPVGGTGTLSLSHLDFKNQTLEKIYAILRKYVSKDTKPVMPSQKIIRIYAKADVGTSVITVNYLGGNR